MSTYKDGTMQIIRQLGERDVEIVQNSDTVVLRVSSQDFEKIMPSDGDRARDVILSPKLDNETKKALAERYGVDPATLSKVTAVYRYKPPTRDLVLCAILQQSPVPTVNEASHILMQMRHPGLFTETSYKKENQRNWLLIQIIQQAQDQPCPGENWQDYAESVLACFGMKRLSNRPVSMDFSDEQKVLMDRWRQELESIGYTDYCALRKVYLGDYRHRQGLQNRGGQAEAYRQLSEKSGIFLDRFSVLFGNMLNGNSKGSREVVIDLAVAMGCTLKETNRMLLQINEALLYPNRADKTELEWVRQLCANETDRN